ncbi:MAG: hypothetical protein O3B87_01545 [bacterium]|nr:hypothetical protein [bacterium]
MEFNRLISLVLGFIVLILVFVWINNRIQAGKTAKTNNGNEIQVTLTITPSPKTNGEKKSWNPFAFLFNNGSPTPTTSKTLVNTNATTSTTPATNQLSGNTTEVQVVTDNKIGGTNTLPYATQIPETGLPSLILPLSFAALAGGMYIKKRS